MKHRISEKLEAIHMPLAAGWGPDLEVNPAAESLPAIGGSGDFGDWYGDILYIPNYSLQFLYATPAVE